MREAFENVKDQIGGCGIWCGSCAVGNGSLRALNDRFKDVLDSHGAEHWAPDDMDYAAFADGLARLREASACTGCRKGGGRDDCELRACSEEHGLSDCSACADFGACGHDELLELMGVGARDAGLFVRDPGEDVDLTAWIERLKGTWPSSILFAEEP